MCGTERSAPADWASFRCPLAHTCCSLAHTFHTLHTCSLGHTPALELRVTFPKGCNPAGSGVLQERCDWTICGARSVRPSTWGACADCWRRPYLGSVTKTDDAGVMDLMMTVNVLRN